MVIMTLDISAAFDNICHTKLLNRLHVDIGVSGIALEWIASYLSDHEQYAQIGWHSSTTYIWTWGFLKDWCLTFYSSQPMSTKLAILSN